MFGSVVYLAGIEKRVRTDYGDEYWEQNKDTILARTKAPQQRKKYNSDDRRKMIRHPEDFTPEQLKEARVWEQIKVYPEEEEDDDEEDDEDDEEEDEE